MSIANTGDWEWGSGGGDPNIESLLLRKNITDLKHITIVYSRHEENDRLADDVTVHFSGGNIDMVFALGLLEAAKIQVFNMGAVITPSMFSGYVYPDGSKDVDPDDELGLREEEEERKEREREEEEDRMVRVGAISLLLRALDHATPREEGRVTHELELMEREGEEGVRDNQERVKASIIHRILGRKTYVLISGSKSIKSLPPEARQLLDQYMEDGWDILVGDAPGVDTLVQKYLRERDYENVCVYYALFNGGGRPRNTNGFPHRGVPGNYSDRDREMCSLAGNGLAIWDGKSKGTRENIRRVERTYIIRVTS